jgi:hypothetical protein
LLLRSRPLYGSFHFYLPGHRRCFFLAFRFVISNFISFHFISSTQSNHFLQEPQNQNTNYNSNGFLWCSNPGLRQRPICVICNRAFLLLKCDCCGLFIPRPRVDGRSVLITVLTLLSIHLPPGSKGVKQHCPIPRCRHQFQWAEETGRYGLEAPGRPPRGCHKQNREMCQSAIKKEVRLNMSMSKN